jgi:hypothetical protein
MMGSTDIVLHFVKVLDQLSIPYMLVGSYSSNYYGRPRETHDADFVLQVADLPTKALQESLGPEFQIDPQMSFETVTATMRWIVKHKASVFKVELFQLSDDAHDQLRFARRHVEQMEGHRVSLPTPEDVVITKLRWSKGGRRQKDILDVREVLAAQVAKLDLPYVRHWADVHGTREIFEKILGEISEP